MNKITGDDGKEYDEEEASEKFEEVVEKNKDGEVKTDDNGNPQVDSEQFLDLLDHFWLKAKIAGMEEERAKGESSNNLYNIAALAMIASCLNTILIGAVAYKVFG